MFLIIFSRFLLFLYQHVHECRAYDTCGDGNHGNANQAYKAAQKASQGSDGIDIAVAHGGERHYGPPEPVADVLERLGLGVALYVVHQYPGETEHDAACRIGGDEFFLYGGQNRAYHPERA